MAKRYVPVRAKIDVCKINTARLRTMTPKQLFNVEKRVVGLNRYGTQRVLLTKKEEVGPRGLLDKFVRNLRGYYQVRRYTEQGHRRPLLKKAADQAEREIWDLQMKQGCRISGNELVARDAAAQGRFSVANRLRRGKKRSPRLPSAEAAHLVIIGRDDAGKAVITHSRYNTRGAKRRRQPLKGRK